MEKMLIMFGSGSNGKSTLENIITQMIGSENICSYPLTELCDEKGYHRAQLAGKMLNIVTEMGGSKINYDYLKGIISHESISARNPFGKPFNFKPEAKLIVSTNTLPHGEPTHGFWRRILLVPFDVIIPEEKQNKNLVNDICENELSGIFNLALQGIQRLVEQQQFSYSEEMKKAIDKYMRETDSVRSFIEDESWEKSDVNKILLKDLLVHYQSYCEASGYTPCSMNKFGNRLRDNGINVEKSSGGYFHAYCEKKIFTNDDIIDLDNKTIGQLTLDKILKFN
jgi:putative DNA primase/helicase